MNGDRGGALLETLVLGFLAAVIVLQVLVAAGRIQVAGEAVAETAQVAASWAARYGDAATAAQIARRMLPGTAVAVNGDEHRIRVEVRDQVSLLSPGGNRVTATVRGRASATLSPYRSRRD